MTTHELIDHLSHLAEHLIEQVLSRDTSVREGIVMTVGPPPYRRLDCDGRALAYIRVRPRKRAVRIDISGLWAAREPSPIRVPSASGAATLLVQNEVDRLQAVEYLLRTVDRTRELEHEDQARRLAAA